jgi:hypothetical protein
MKLKTIRVRRGGCDPCLRKSADFLFFPLIAQMLAEQQSELKI